MSETSTNIGRKPGLAAKFFLAFAFVAAVFGFVATTSTIAPASIGTVAVASADSGCKVDKTYPDGHHVQFGCPKGFAAQGVVSATGGANTTVREDATQGTKRGPNAAGVMVGIPGSVVRSSDIATVTTCAGDLINGGYAGGLASGAMDLGPSYDNTYVGPNVKC